MKCIRCQKRFRRKNPRDKSERICGRTCRKAQDVDYGTYMRKGRLPDGAKFSQKGLPRTSIAPHLRPEDYL